MTALICLALAVATTDPLDPSRHGPFPWHLADISHGNDLVIDFRSVSVELMLLDDIDPNTNMFVVPISGWIDNKSFYVGQMTRLTETGGPVYFVHDPRPGYTYSRWGDMNPASVRPAPDGRSLLWDGEGSLASVRIFQPWAKGRYTYRLERAETATTPEGTFTWSTATVVCHATGRKHLIGSLRHPGEGLTLGRNLGSFVEVYGPHPGDPKPLRVVPPFRLLIGNWRVNDAPLPPAGIRVHYPSGSPQVAEVKQVDEFLADRECEKLPDLPLSANTVGIVVRPKPVPHRAPAQSIWQPPATRPMGLYRPQ